MPKTLALGNGHILICLDHFAQVNDFYFPYVGLENHVGGSYRHFAHKIGVYSSNQFSWLDDGDWKIEISSKDDTLAGMSVAQHENIGIELKFLDVVYNEKNIFVRKITARNLFDKKRKVKLFFNQQFEISGSHRGETAFYDPTHRVVIHYKGRRVFLANAMVGDKSVDDFSTGLLGIEGKEGTFKDAESGKLSENPIEHGKVDSVISISFDLEPGESKVAYYWIVVAETIDAAHNLNDYALKKHPQYLIESTIGFWKAWVNKQNFYFHGLDDDIIKLFKSSLVYVRSHADNNGSIIASGDANKMQYGRDTYAYMWPRDGSRSAYALDKAGDVNVARRFYEFCNDVISEGGYFRHKYLPDKSLGSSWHPWIKKERLELPLPIQEDETALVTFGLWEHYKVSRDLEFLERVYDKLIRQASEFMVTFTHDGTGLSLPSYDIWEEKYGINTFTCSAKYGALMAASSAAKLLGKEERVEKYNKVALRLKNAIMEHLYDEETGYFYKMINITGDKIEVDKTIDMSSIFGIFKFGVLDYTDPRLERAIKVVEKELKINTPVSGVPRYIGDNYYRVNPNAPSNPWIITTLWLAQYYIGRAKKEEDMEPVKKWLKWCLKYALPSGILSEQIHPTTGEQLSVAPLVWSHSEFIITVIEYMEKLEQLGVAKAYKSII